MRFDGRLHQFGPEVVELQWDGSCGLTDCLILVESAAHNKSSVRKKFSSIIRRLNMIILQFSSRLCRLSLFGEQNDKQQQQADGRRRRRAKKHLNLFNWSMLWAILLIASIVGALQNTYHHYAYDYYVFQLDRVRKAAAAKCLGNDIGQLDKWPTACREDNSSSRIVWHLSKRMEEKRRRLVRTGSPLISAPTFSAECCYITWVSYTLLIFWNLVKNLTGGRMRTNFTRLLSDPREEQRRLNRLALREVNKYLASNFNFNDSDVWRAWTKDRAAYDEHKARALAQDYEQNKNILRSILMKGNIVRFFSFSSDWLDTRALLHGSNSIFTNLFYVTNTLIMLVRLRNGSQHQEQRQLQEDSDNHLNELISMGQVLVLVIFFIFVGVFFALISLVDWLDELEVTRRLRNLLQDCIQTNNNIYSGALQICSKLQPTKNQTIDNSKRWMINANLLFALINYKVFPQRAKGSFWIQNNGANLSLRLMYVFPVIVRLHAPYCAPDILMSMVYICIINWLITTLLMVNSCHLNAKTKQLHKPLASLLAHVIELNEQSKGTSSASVYAEHSVMILRLELTDMDRFQDNFLPPQSSPLTIAFNYQFFIKAQFWLHLILVSIMTPATRAAPNTGFQEPPGAGSLLADPLRLFGAKFH